MHITFWYVVLVCHQYDVCTNYAGSVYVSVVFGFLTVVKSPSVLL